MKNGISWVIRGLGIVLALLGLGLAGGGLKLVTLGGSWFYLVAGLAMIAVGVFALRRQAPALWIALGLLAVNLIWAFAEVGLDYWQLFPRIMTFLVIALVAAAISPHLARKSGAPALGCKPAAALTVVLAIGFVAMLTGMFRPHAQVVASGPAAPVIQPEAGADSGNDWPAYGRSTAGNRFAQFDQINASNVKNLEVAWTYRTGDLAVDGKEYQVTPLKVGNSMFLCTPSSIVIAIDPVTGAEKWKFDPKAEVFESTKGWRRCRGVGYADLTGQLSQPANDASGLPLPVYAATDPVACRKRVVVTTIDARLFTLDAETGALCEDFGTNGYVDLTIGLSADPKDGQQGSYNVTSAPLVADGVVLVGGRLNDNLTVGEPSGVVRGFDVRTGQLLWAWDAARGATSSTPLPAGETYAPETPNFWGTAAYDPALGLAYFPTGNQTPDFWTGNRHPYSDEYNDAIVAVDMKTGREAWHFRTANIDQFDYDVSSQPILYDLKKDGETIPVIIQLTKRAQIFVLDRRTGEPVFPVEERAVSTDAMPDMKVAPTQPYSALSVGADKLTESDMWGGTIFDQLVCRIQFKEMRWEGEFTPLSDKQRTLIYPGYYGGFNWGGGAIDASTGTLIVNDIRMAQWGQFIKQDEAIRVGLKPSTEGEYSTQTGTPWGVERSMFVSPFGVPCFKPPFGSMTAIDLTTGKTKWQVPMGSIQDAPVMGIVPGVHVPLGMPTMGGPLVTGGGLTFFHGTLDYYTRALDSNTGEELWRGRLPVGGQGAPMSYIGEDGRQYIVVVAGGATRTGSNENRGDYVIAYALPRQ